MFLNVKAKLKCRLFPIGTMGGAGSSCRRDAKVLYVSNRGTHEHEGSGKGHGSVSVIDFATRKVATTWDLPGYSSPDMGGVSADGSTLWLAGSYNKEVYAINTADGTLRARIPVGKGPHGLSATLLQWMERASAGFADHVIIANDLWLDRYSVRTRTTGRCTAFINNVDTRVFLPRRPWFVP